MCGRCEGEPYRAVQLLLHGDLQPFGEGELRRDWLMVSPAVIVHLGAASLENHENPLIRDCEIAFTTLLTPPERQRLGELSIELTRPITLY